MEERNDELTRLSFFTNMARSIAAAPFARGRSDGIGPWVGLPIPSL